MVVSYNLNILQGSTFTATITGLNDDGSLINFSGYSISGHARWRYASGILINLNPTTGSGNGLININLPATGTAALPTILCPYDIHIYSGDYAQKIVMGNMSVFPYLTH